MSDEEELVRIHVDLPNHWATGGEAMWAEHLGDNLYEIRNVPFFAYDLNYLDIVEAVSPESDRIPEIRKVMERSGHRTLRVIFQEDQPADACIRHLEELKSFRTSFEGVSDRYFAIDVEPEGDFEATEEQLKLWLQEGVLEYETCEARVEGSFDDAPQDE